MIPRPEVSAWLVAGLCILFYIDPAGLFLPLLFACAVHEAAHIFCARLLGIPLLRFQLTLLGARLVLQNTSSRNLLLCTLAGPAASLLLGAACLPFAPRLAFVSIVLGVFNLLPFRALDGGQILLLLSRSDSLFRLIQLFFFLLAFLCALILAAAGFGIWPVLTISVLLLRGGIETAVAKRAENS